MSESAATAEQAHIVLTFPSGDALFRQDVAGLIRDVRQGALTIRMAARRLRVTFPAADLQHQEAVLIRGVPTQAWFAHRDGRGAPAMPSGPWWDSKRLAVAVLESTGRLRSPNLALRSLVGNRRDRSRGLAIWDVIPSAARDVFRAGGTGRASGDLTSIARLRGADGEWIWVEFHIMWNSGSAGHRLVIRTLATRDGMAQDQAVASSSLGILSPRHRDLAIGHASHLDLAAGQRLSVSIRGDPWVVLVVAGVARLYVSAEDGEPTLFYGTSGLVVGTHWRLAGRVVDLAFQAVYPVRVLVLDPQRIEGMLRTDPRFERATSQETLTALNHAVNSYAMGSRAPLSQRLARHLLLLDKLQSERCLVPVTEQQLADGIGALRESVGRTIASLRQRGSIATTRNGVIILDAERLRQIAAGH
jgi:hypothetical protein